MLSELDTSSHWLAGDVAGIHYFTLVGGALIGASAALLYHTIGRIAGVSGIFFTMVREGRLWRVLFLVGIVLGAAVGAYLFPTLNILTRPNPGFWVLVSAGLLVGWGTRQGGGCTSGHGVCGIGRLSLRSVLAVLVFMAAGVFTASVLRHWLGVPA